VHTSTMEDEMVPVVVLETKHESSVKLKVVAQAIGYYACAKKNYTGTGIALVLNEYQGEIGVRFILFPYTDSDTFGAQALLLPACTV